MTGAQWDAIVDRNGLLPFILLEMTIDDKAFATFSLFYLIVYNIDDIGRVAGAQRYKLSMN